VQPQDPISTILDSQTNESFKKEPAPKPQNVDPAQLSLKEIRRFAESPEGLSLIEFVEKSFNSAKNARLSYERKWYKCLDMYRGEHYSQWQPQQKRMARVVAPQWDRQPVINKIRPIIRTEVAKTTSQEPNASVAPATNDEEDVQMAQAGEAAWRHQYAESQFHTETLQPAEFWRATTGNGFIKTYMDFTEVDKITTNAMARQMAEQYPGAEAFIQKKEVYGVIKHEMVTPFHLYVSNLEEPSLRKQPWVIHVQTKTLEVARRQFKDFVEEDWAPTTVSTASIIDVSRLGDRSGKGQESTQVLIKEMWLKPGAHRSMPKGGMVTIVDDTIVYLSQKGNPYEHGEHPFAHLTGISTGLFYRESVIVDLISPQQELNLTFAQIIKAKNLASKPQMFFVAGSVDTRRIVSKPGLYIEVIQGFDFPKPVPVTDMPGYVQSFPAQMSQAMEDISGQHDVSRGESPTSGASATMIAYLGERDDSYLSEVFKGLEVVYQTCARQFLALAVQYWDEPRMIKVVGEEAGQDARMLKGADIGSGTDIRIEAGSSLPVSKAARIALLTEWMKLGFITVEQGMKALQMGMVNQLLNTIKQDEAQAQRENVRMKETSPVDAEMHSVQQQMNQMQPQIDPMTGAPVPPPAMFPTNEFDNHVKHLEVHGRFLKSQAYESLEPAIQQILLEHWREHKQKMAQEMQMQALGGMPADPNSAGSPEPGAQESTPAGVPDTA